MSQGLRVPRGSVVANSVVTVLPTIMALAVAGATMLAPSRSVRQPTKQRKTLVGRRIGSLYASFMPTGMPSIGDKGWPARQRSVDRFAASLTWPVRAF